MIGMRVNMPKGKQEEGIKRWLHELDRGIQLREKEEKRWEANEQFENMYQWDGQLGVDDQVTVNKLGSYIRTYRSRIAFNDPRAKLTPRTSDGWDPIPVPMTGPDGQPKIDPLTGQVMVRQVVKAKVREALLNDILSAPLAGTQSVGSRLVKAGTLGWGCLKSGYEPSFSTDPEPDGEQEIKINEDGSLSFDEYAKNPVTGNLEMDDRGRLIRRDSVPIYEDFFIRWVPYRNMIIDPDGGNDWSDHSWVAEECIRPWEEVKDDPLFKNTKDLEPSGYRRDKEDGDAEWVANEGDWKEEDSEVRDAAKVVRLFEIYDLKNERLIVLADGHGKYLRDDSMPLGITDHPYSDFRPNEILGRFYPRPIATDLCPINQWYNIARQMELRAMQRSTRKIFSRKGAMNVHNLEAFTSDEDMAVIEIDTRGHVDLGTAIMPYTPPPVSEAIYRNSELIARDFDEIGGISEAGRGNATGGTATETNVMEQYSGARIDFDRKVLGETWRRAIKKLNDSIDANMTVERAIMLEGSDGIAFSGLVDRDMIAGDFDVEVDVEDMAPVNSAMEGAQLIQFLQVAGQNLLFLGDEVIAREFLSKFGIRNERLVQRIVQMVQMQMQMQQQQMAIEAAQAVPGPEPNAPPPTSEADAVSQAAAGGQSPRMSGAT